MIGQWDENHKLAISCGNREGTVILTGWYHCRGDYHKPDWNGFKEEVRRIGDSKNGQLFQGFFAKKESEK